MIFTTRMVYLTAVSLQEHADAIAGEFLRLGLMHFVDIATVDHSLGERKAELFTEKPVDLRREQSAEARRRIEAILGYGGFNRPAVGAKELSPVSDSTMTDALTLAQTLGSRIDQVREQQRSIQQQIHRLEDVGRHLPAAGAGIAKSVGGLGQGGAFLDIRTGTVPSARRESLEQKLSLFPAVFTPVSRRGDRDFFVLVGMKRNHAEIEEILRAHDFHAEAASTDVEAETRETLDARIASLKVEQREHAETIPKIIGTKRDELENAWRGMRVQELLSTIHENFSRTRRVVIASGWIPGSDRKRVEAALNAVCKGHVYLEWHEDREFVHGGDHGPAEGPVIPSRLENPKFLGPFQSLVTNFGIPAYGTVDPTGLVAIAYLVMFGLMFGDAGHGLILILSGVLGTLWSRKKTGGGSVPAGGIAGAIPLLSRLMLWCGSAAVVTGVLFGSYFGFSWFPPLWFDYHGVVAGHVHAGPVQGIFDVLTITIYFGIFIIALGLFVNWINLFRQRRWFPLFFDKAGVLGGIIYGAGVAASAQFASTGFRTVPSDPVVLGLIIVPAVVLFLKGPLEGHSRNPLWWVMDWIIELLEVFSGYLANTLSFMRVAGLGIAHVTLMIAFFQIAKMASPEGMNAMGIVILVLGNALVIVLEGLSAGIQSLRLNYYEFFSKHFQPSGVAYRPVSLEVS